MHRKLEAYLLPLDTEIEKTLKNMRKVTSAKSTNMENQEKDYKLFKNKQKQIDLKGK